MNDLPNLKAALTNGSRFVQATWQQAVLGAATIPGVPEVKANINLRRLYADSIVLGDQLAVPEAGFLRSHIIATKRIAVDLEYGKPAWDMKPMLLHGPKARVSKKGKLYNIIPFRHGTSAAHGRNTYFPTMPKDILQQAKNLAPSVAMMQPRRVRLPGGKIQTSMQHVGTKWGGRLTGTENRHPSGQNPTTGYQHKTGRYEGMVRIQKTYDKATQSKYMTFRVASENSDPASWWHPGYKAHHIAKGVSEYTKPTVEAMLRQAAIADMIPTGGLSVGIRIVTGV